MKRNLLGGVVALSLWVLSATTVHADYLQTWSLNTSELALAPAGDVFTINLAITDGSSAGGDGNNTATITAFTVNGGSLNGPATTTGGASGDLASTAVLTDSGFLNTLAENFTPGSSLVFTIDLTENVSASETSSPDSFTFTITDSKGAINYDLSAQKLGNNLLAIDVTGAPPSIFTGGYNVGTGPFIDPQPVNPVPAPSSLVLLLSAAAALGVGVFFRRSALRLAV